MTKIYRLPFSPLGGFFSRHLQTILPMLLSAGHAPISQNCRFELGGGDALSCKISTPIAWQPSDSTIVLIHGLGGSAASNYMVRMARKSYLKGFKVVRVNLRGCGTEQGLSKLPYHAGVSDDVLQLLKKCKKENPASPITLIGFSLGGNIVLKLMGELGEEASQWIHQCFSVCSPLNLGETVKKIDQKRYRIYKNYYLKKISRQMHQWVRKKVNSLFDLDETVTAALWGFDGASDYYDKCSSMAFLPRIRCTTHLLFAEDDPFIDLACLNQIELDDSVSIWVTKHGGHMGFIGKTKSKDLFWVDELLLKWLDGDFVYS